MLNDISGVAGWAKVRRRLQLHCRAPHTKCTPQCNFTYIDIPAVQVDITTQALTECR